MLDSKNTFTLNKVYQNVFDENSETIQAQEPFSENGLEELNKTLQH
jgi:hypothetical protein